MFERIRRLFHLRRSARAQRLMVRSLSQAIEQSDSAVMITDLESRIQYVNAGLCRQIGYTAEEMVGKSWRDFQQPETPPEVLAELVSTVRSGRPWRSEWFNRRKNGEIYTVRGCVSPVTDDAGQLARFVTIFEDLTETRRNETVLREALERAAEGERAKSRFLATMSHEMRTPLNGIAGFTALLRGTELTPEQDEFVENIRISGEALIQLTDDILELARIEGGNLKLEPAFCDLRQCLEDVLDLLSVRAAEKGVELLHWVDEGVPPTVVVDEVRFRQVLLALIGNAVKFTRQGEVEVTLRADLVLAGTNAEWRLFTAVRDTGIGIDPADLEKLFKPFSQVDESSTRRYGGTGLGLAISQNLVELMGGRIEIDSARGQGSTFRFSIPVAVESHTLRTPPDLGQRRIALAAHPGPFRGEFGRLARRWRVVLLEFDTPEALAAADWDIAFVELSAELAERMAQQPPDRPDRTYGVVSADLPRTLRATLRGHFHLLLNKPLHHEALPYLLAGHR
jgi:PAS domain S-box-containing protein